MIQLISKLECAMNNYEYLKPMCKAAGFPEGKTTEEYLFTLNAVNTFFYKRNIGLVDIKSCFVDGANDGGIDYIYSSDDTMYLIQGKSTENLSNEEICNIFDKIDRTVRKFENKDSECFSQKLQTSFQNAYDELSDEKNIELVLFTNTVLDDSMRKKLDDFSKAESMLNYKLNVYDINDIKEKEAILSTNSELVAEDKILLWPQDGGNKNDCLQYGANGIIVNVRASSLKKLYKKYKDNGLFSYNLREFIAQKVVDDGITTTIKTDKDNFWFYNNGITIGCEDFDKDGNNIKLYGFSIINGAQTTSKIGQSPLVKDDNDFALVCKIVKSTEEDSLNNSFIGKISEASNSQKPIKPRDLKANSKEQRNMQTEAANNGKYQLAIEIKRGVKAPNYSKVEKWQKISNEYIGQMILGPLLQFPGYARSAKTTMFSSSEKYNKVFRSKHDYDTLYDLVRIGSIYDKYVEIESANFKDEKVDIEKLALMRNGKMAVISTIMYLYKKRTKIIDDYNSPKFHEDNIKGLLITNYKGDDLEQRLFDLFTFVINNLRLVYNTYRAEYKITSYSNFFKSDKYYELICKHFDDIKESYDLNKMNDYLSIFDK